MEPMDGGQSLTPGRYCFGLDRELCSRLRFGQPQCVIALNVVCLLTGVLIFVALLAVALHGLIQD